MLTKHLRDSMEWALMAALVLGGGALAQAQQKDTEPEGRIVQIGPTDEQTQPADTHQTTITEGTPNNAAQPAVPTYWIGMLGGPVTPELRAHLDIPADQGVMILNVVPNSPAAGAGLEQFDVVLAANGTPLHSMGDLVGLVAKAGEDKSPIEVEVIHRGQVETISVTPTERPEELAHLGQGAAPGRSLGIPSQGIPEELLRQFGRQFNFPEGGTMQFRSFGPGASAGGHSSSTTQLPGGVSVSVQREEGQPAQVTVERGGESWTVQGDNPESLTQLPEDLRPLVEQALHGEGGVGLPGGMHSLPWTGETPEIQDDELRARIEAMERQMEALEERLLESTPTPSAEESAQ